MTAPSDAVDEAHGRRRAAWRWWSGLQPTVDGRPNPRADRGALARLRRAATPFDVLDEEVVYALHAALGFGRKHADVTLVPVAIAASVLARVREHDPTRKPARAAGRERFSDRDFETAVLKPDRMRRLQKAREPGDLHRQMRRLVDLCGPRLDVGALAVLILDWCHEERGPKVRAQFAYDYFAAGGSKLDATPDLLQTDPSPR